MIYNKNYISGLHPISGTAPKTLGISSVFKKNQNHFVVFWVLGKPASWAFIPCCFHSYRFEPFTHYFWKRKNRGYQW